MSYDAYTELLKPIVVDDRSIDFDRVVDVHDELLNQLNVRFLLAEPGHEPGGRWRAVYRGPDGTLFDNPAARARFFVAEGVGNVAIAQKGPTRFRLQIEAHTPVRIASSQVTGPGWRVSAGERNDRIFIEFRLPAGDHTVEVDYRPLSFRAGVVMAIVALVVLVGIASGRGPLRGVPNAATRSLTSGR
jgi:hypothetical protein